MSDAPSLYDQDDETIERVLNEERMAAMRSHIADLEERIRELESRNALLQMMIDELVKPPAQEKADV